MKYLSEVESEALLEEFGFRVVRREFCSNKSKLKGGIMAVGGFPFVMKAVGKKLVHKQKQGGVKLSVKTYSNAILDFNHLKKIRGSKGVLLQEKLNFSKEFILGIKNTRDFGHVLLFGEGGVEVREKKDVSFRVCPLERVEARKMIRETKIYSKISKKELKELEAVILKLCAFSNEHPDLYELDINPLVFSRGKSFVLDSKIIFR